MPPLPHGLLSIWSRPFLALVLVLYALLASLPARAIRADNAQAPAPLAFGAPEFADLWSQTDEPVSSGAVSRSWLWGPTPGITLSETYAQGLNGARVVQYFDKARM